MLKGLGNLANLGSMLKQAQEMGSRLQGMQDELKAKRAVGTSGGGLVEVEVNGIGEVLAVRIEPSFFDRGDREMMEDMVAAAVNQAVAKTKQLHAETMKGMTSGLELPGLEDALASLTGGAPTGEEQA